MATTTKQIILNESKFVPQRNADPHVYSWSYFKVPAIPAGCTKLIEIKVKGNIHGYYEREGDLNYIGAISINEPRLFAKKANSYIYGDEPVFNDKTEGTQIDFSQTHISYFNSLCGTSTKLHLQFLGAEACDRGGQITGQPWDEARFYKIGSTSQITIQFVYEQLLPITEKLTHVISLSGNPTTIIPGQGAGLNYSADPAYKLPDTIEVQGAQYNWNKSTGHLLLSKATAPVFITIKGIPKNPKIYEIRNHLIGLYPDELNPTTISTGETITLRYVEKYGYSAPLNIVAISVSGAIKRKWENVSKNIFELTISDPSSNVDIDIDSTITVPEPAIVHGDRVRNIMAGFTEVSGVAKGSVLLKEAKVRNKIIYKTNFKPFDVSKDFIKYIAFDRSKSEEDFRKILKPGTYDVLACGDQGNEFTLTISQQSVKLVLKLGSQHIELFNSKTGGWIADDQIRDSFYVFQANPGFEILGSDLSNFQLYQLADIIGTPWSCNFSPLKRGMHVRKILLNPDMGPNRIKNIFLPIAKSHIGEVPLIINDSRSDIILFRPYPDSTEFKFDFKIIHIVNGVEKDIYDTKTLAGDTELIYGQSTFGDTISSALSDDELWLLHPYMGEAPRIQLTFNTASEDISIKGFYFADNWDNNDPAYIDLTMERIGEFGFESHPELQQIESPCVHHADRYSGAWADDPNDRFFFKNNIYIDGEEFGAWEKFETDKTTGISTSPGNGVYLLTLPCDVRY